MRQKLVSLAIHFIEVTMFVKKLENDKCFFKSNPFLTLNNISQIATSEAPDHSASPSISRNTFGMIIDEDTDIIPSGRNMQKTNEDDSKIAYPDMENLKDRVISFRNWPLQMTQHPRDMAQAGFFYNGVGDTTTCFWCGKAVHEWRADEDPVVEHKKHYGKCKYIRMTSM